MVIFFVDHAYLHTCYLGSLRTRIRKTGGNRSSLTGSRWNRSVPVHEPVRFPPKTVPNIFNPQRTGRFDRYTGRFFWTVGTGPPTVLLTLLRTPLESPQLIKKHWITQILKHNPWFLLHLFYSLLTLHSTSFIFAGSRSSHGFWLRLLHFCEQTGWLSSCH
jgi:hypothetical protein